MKKNIMLKRCKICNIEKDYNLFYNHPKCKDGLSHKCKDCSKIYTKERLKEKKKNPNFKEEERLRGRKRYHTEKSSKNITHDYRKINLTEEQLKFNLILNGKIWRRKNKKTCILYKKQYKERYPEKIQARSSSKRTPKKEGEHLHHWSYNKEHWKDVIIIKKEDHYNLHKYIIYDQERMMYRDLNGLLLDTKQSHINLLNKLK